MTYEQMMLELDQIPMFGKAAGLTNLSMYLEYLNHPEESLRVIHVAGTNGKGSVSSYIESGLRQAGYSTALFTSPHLLRINERIRINYQECDDQEMADAYERVKKLMEHREEYSLKMLTYFEVLFLMGMIIFEKHKPDYCIVETGLGGRMDATVLTKAVLCVITSISLDHTAILGDTLEKIAAEKAGIIRENVPLVVMKEDQAAYEVICKIAEKKHAPIYEIEAADAHISKKTRKYIDFSMENSYYKNGMLRIQTIASYQVNNAMMAALSLHLLDAKLTKEQIAKGLYEMHWEGRMEEVLPGLFVDGAHNPGAMEKIKETMQGQDEDWNLLFAVCQDKDYHSMIESLKEISWKTILVTRFSSDRSLDVDKIAMEFEKHSQSNVIVCENIEEALFKVMEEGLNPLLCLGSLYLVGEVKAYCNKKRKK